MHTYSESDSSSNAASIQYLNDNKSLPIYSRQNKLRTSSLQTVRAILDCPANLLRSSHPINISINCAFVVDTSKLRDSNDIKCDDCGVWKQTKTTTNHLKLTFDEDGAVNIATQPQLTLQSLISSITPLLTPKTGYPQKPATIKSEKPFYIAQLNNRIKKCSGCGHFFREVGTVTPDFVLGHLERDWYPAEGCQWKLGSYQNKYYHIKPGCVQQRCSSYRFPEDITDIQIGSNIPTSLKQVLLNAFKLQI